MSRTGLNGGTHASEPAALELERCGVDCDHATQSECIAHLRERNRVDTQTKLDRSRIMRELVEARIQRNHPRDWFAYVFVDLDSFKLFNDRYGQIVGDDIIRTAAEAIRETIRGDRGDHASRRGGDEFVVILSQPHRPHESGERIRKHVIDRLGPWSFRADDGVWTQIGASVGVSVWRDDGETWATIDAVAHARMRADKARRKAAR